MDKIKRKAVKMVGSFPAWMTPIVSYVSLPAHAQTSCNISGTTSVGLAESLVPLPSSLNIAQGSNSKIDITAEIGTIYEQGGEVSISVSSTPSTTGISTSISNSAIPAGGIGTATITIFVDVDVALGTNNNLSFDVLVEGLRGTGCGNNQTYSSSLSVSITVV